MELVPKVELTKVSPADFNFEGGDDGIDYGAKADGVNTQAATLTTTQQQVTNTVTQQVGYVPVQT